MIFKKLSKKMTLSTGIALISFGGIFTITSGLMAIPGMGIESLNFINSVEKQIDVILPKGKYILNGDSMAYDMVVHNSLKASFTADALSTYNFKTDDENGQQVSKQKEFAENWWNKYWEKKTSEKEDIDLNEIGKNMIVFDKAVADEFHSYGYVHTGFGWLFSKNGLSEIFSQSMYDHAVQQQSIINQSDYEANLIWQPTGLGKFEVLGSSGGNIVNNKVWLLNQQIEGLKLLVSLSDFDLSGITGTDVDFDIDLGVLKDTSLSSADIATKITVADLAQPNFTNAIQVTRTAVVMMFLSLVILPTSLGFGILAIIEAKKKG